jgi:hypothetical protein
MNYILRSINVLNILLGTALFSVITFFILPMDNTFSLPVVAAPRGPVSAQEEPEAEKNSADAMSDYLVIADHNAFHQERIIPVEKKVEKKEEEKPLPQPDFVLYGTILDGAVKMAFMDDLKAQHSTPGRGKRQRVISKGGNLSDFVLDEVYEDKVVMVRNKQKIVVTLQDRKNKRTSPAEITSVQPPKRSIPKPVQQPPGQ